MDEYRFVKLAGTIEDLFHSSDIVPVNGSEVFQAKVFKHCLRDEGVFKPCFQAMQRAVSCSSWLTEIHESPFAPRQCFLIVLR